MIYHTLYFSDNLQHQSEIIIVEFLGLNFAETDTATHFLNMKVIGCLMSEKKTMTSWNTNTHTHNITGKKHIVLRKLDIDKISTATFIMFHGPDTLIVQFQLLIVI